MSVGHCFTQLGSGGTVSPPVDPGEHPGGGQGEAPGNLRNLAFSVYKMETKNSSHRTNCNLSIFFLATDDYFHWNQWR